MSAKLKMSIPLVMALCVLFFVPAVTNAQVLNDQLEFDVLDLTGKAVGGSAADAISGEGVASPALIAVNIIDGLLVLVGIMFLGYALYGGYMYATARGDSDQVKKAIAIFRRAIVGIIIILFSYAITTFLTGTFVGKSGSLPGAGNADCVIGGSGPNACVF